MEECIDFLLLLFWSILSIVECVIYDYHVVVQKAKKAETCFLNYY